MFNENKKINCKITFPNIIRRLEDLKPKSVYVCLESKRERDSNVAHSQRLWLRGREHNAELSNSTGLLITHTHANTTQQRRKVEP